MRPPHFANRPSPSAWIGALLSSGAVILSVIAGIPAWAREDGLSDEASVAAEIDAMLDARMAEAGIAPAPPASDAEFLRRVSLDLVGTVPTAAEADTFLADRSPGKQERLVAELVDSAGHARHLARRWTRRMLPNDSDPTDPTAADRLERFFFDRFVEGWRYDRLVEDFLAARGRADDGPGVYYRSLELKPERLAGSTARIFLGLQLDCAECHDHPFDRWTQRDFWGYAAFFARLDRPDQDAGMAPTMVLRERETGEVTLPETDEVVPPKFPGGEAPPLDEGSLRREQLAIWVTARENPYLARAAVNRVWADLFGRGLVEPVDDLRSGNPATHPEVLDRLTEDFVAHGFDLGRVYRILAGTDAYRRSSRWPAPAGADPTLAGAGGADRREATDLRAVMPVKVLPPEELFDVIVFAARGRSGRPAGMSGLGGPSVDEDAAFVAAQRQAFLARMERRVSSATEYEQGAPQALLMMNGDLVGRLITPTSGGLVTALSAPWLDDRSAVEALFLATLTRRPTDAEREAALAALAEASDLPTTGPDGADVVVSPARAERVLALRRGEVLADLLWAAINTAEFACVP